jgi:hypothetical protein
MHASHCVSVEGEMSTLKIMQSGEPQCSLLSPTLFNVYINDTPQTIRVHLALCADDACLYGQNARRAMS